MMKLKKYSDSFINKKCHFFMYFIYLIALLHAIFCLFLLVALSRNYQRYRQKLPWRNLKNCMYWVDVSGRCSCKRTHIQTIFFPGKLIFIISNFHEWVFILLRNLKQGFFCFEKKINEVPKSQNVFMLVIDTKHKFLFIEISTVRQMQNAHF